MRLLATLRPLVIGCLALTILGVTQTGAARTIPGVSGVGRALHSLPVDAPHALTLALAGRAGAPPAPAAPAPGWLGLIYGGAQGLGGAMPGYNLAYPRRWTARLWPDTFAEYGRLDLRSPAGSVVDIALIPLRPSGPTLANLISNDRAFLFPATQDSVALPLGTALRLSGARNLAAGRVSEVLYLRRGAVVYRLFSARPAESPDGDALLRVALTLRALPSGLYRTTIPAPAPAPQQPTETCCHCPAWGPGWGTVLTSLDGVPVYWNAGNGNNGCVGTYGILYQCVELAQRYFAQRWGYPAMWWGVGAAADMRVNHPGDIQFVPNGGAPGPWEGDALIFYGGAFGHVALVRNVDRQSGRIDLVEENWSPSGASSLPIYGDSTIGIRDGVYGSYTVAGWLHSPKNGERSG